MTSSLKAIQHGCQSLQGKPSEIDLDHVSKNAGDTWRSLLTHLGVPLAKCKALFVEYRGSPVSACFEGLVFWKEGNEPCKPATWSVLLEALEKGAEKAEYAKELRESIPIGIAKKAGQTQRNTLFSRGSKKINNLLDVYENREISMPKDDDLEDNFDSIMETIEMTLSSANPKEIDRLLEILLLKYRRHIHGVRLESMPLVPKTANGLLGFITEKSTPYEICLMNPVANALDIEELNRDFQKYELKLVTFFHQNSTSCKKQKVPLRLHKDHTHMAVVISEEQVLLSLVLELKEYFSKYLQLEETLFEGFDEGSTVLFFSILRVDAVLLSPKVLSHLSELKRMFGMTHLIVFGYFACDLEKATIELVPNSELVEQEDEVKGTLPTFPWKSFRAVCRNKLKDKIDLYIQAAHALVQHRDAGMEYCHEVADDLNASFEDFVKAKKTENVFNFAGLVFAAVGLILLVGGYETLAGFTLMAVGGALLLGGSMNRINFGTMAIAVENKDTLKTANKWIRHGSELCRDLIIKHQEYDEEVQRICQRYNETEKNAIKTAFGYNDKGDDMEIHVNSFQSADKEAQLTIIDWNKALELGANATATAFVTGTRIAGETVRVGAGEAGAAVARVTVQTPGGVVIGLSAVFMVVDLTLIGETAYDLNKNKDTELANKLHQTADDMEKETSQLRPLADFVYL